MQLLSGRSNAACIARHTARPFLPSIPTPASTVACNASYEASLKSSEHRYPEPNIATVRSTEAPQRRLINKHITLNPIEGVQRYAQTLGCDISVHLAAHIDRYPPVAASVIAAQAIATGLGANPVVLLTRGMSQGLGSLLDTLIGYQDTWVQIAVALAATALPFGWALRSWWEAQMSAALPAAQHFCRAASTATAVACLLTASRLGLLYLCYEGLAGAAAGAGVGAAAAALLSFALSYAPLALPGASAQLAQSKASTVALLCGAAAEVSWLGVASRIGGWPLTYAFAAMHAAALVAIWNLVLPARLLRHKVQAGDRVKVHVRASLQNGAVFADTQRQGCPLEVVAASIRKGEGGGGGGSEVEHQAAGGDAAAPGDSSSREAATTSAAAAGAGEAESSSGGAGGGVYSQQQQELAAGRRFRGVEAFQAAIAACAPGLFVGEHRSISIDNPPAGGFYDPQLCWWQPREDFVSKFRRQPVAGQVFWYPIADGAPSWVPTQVVNVGPQFVQLDANFGLTGREMQLGVRVAGVLERAGSAAQQQ